MHHTGSTGQPRNVDDRQFWKKVSTKRPLNTVVAERDMGRRGGRESRRGRRERDVDVEKWTETSCVEMLGSGSEEGDVTVHYGREGESAISGVKEAAYFADCSLSSTSFNDDTRRSYTRSSFNPRHTSPDSLIAQSKALSSPSSTDSSPPKTQDLFSLMCQGPRV